MKKGQSGVSLIALVITIIVVIILAAIAFGTSTSTIKNANWSDFVNDIAEVKGQLETAAVTLQGNQVADGNDVSIQQAYNYVAKGATTLGGTQENWLSRSRADAIQCTQLHSGDGVMKKVIGMDLPSIKVNTYKGTKIDCAYFVTPDGQVFVWPPFEHDGEYWVNGTTNVSSKDEKAIFTDSADTFEFSLNNGRKITVSKATSLTTPAYNVTVDALKAGPSIAYTDGAAAASPVGLETAQANWYTSANS